VIEEVMARIEHNGIVGELMEGEHPDLVVLHAWQIVKGNLQDSMDNEK
jgi:hypothetical protein